MTSNVKNMRRPSILSHTSSVRSCSAMSFRSTSSMSTWDPDASVRLFIERSQNASTFDDETYSPTAWTGPISPGTQFESPLASPTGSCDASIAKAETSYGPSIFSREMSTCALVEAAREASQALSIATTADIPYPNSNKREHFVGFGKLAPNEVTFSRPRRARKNRWAASTRRYVDILT